MMEKRLILLVTGVIFFFIFIFFSYLVHKDLFTTTDFNTTVRLQDHISRRFDPYFSELSALGSFEASLVILLIIFVLIRSWWTIAAFLSFIGFHLIEIYGKSYVNHPPPPQFMLRTQIPVNFPQFHVRSEFSYPSGHSGRTMFLSVLVLYVIYRMKQVPLWMKISLVVTVLVYDGLMLTSRIYLGEHWLSDVIGGTLLGIALGLLNLSLAKFPASSSD